MNKRGKIIVLEGIDKAGKSTQSHMLLNYLRGIYSKQISVLSFPDYDSPTGKEIRAYLDGLRNNYSSEWLHLIYAANRYEWKKIIEKALDEEQILILNRYFESNIVYGAIHGASIDWLVSLDYYMPKPDLTIILDIPVSESSKRTNNPDVNESDIQLLQKVRTLFLDLARSYNWEIINANRSKQEVHKDIVMAVEKKLSSSLLI